MYTEPHDSTSEEVRLSNLCLTCVYCTYTIITQETEGASGCGVYTTNKGEFEQARKKKGSNLKRRYTTQYSVLSRDSVPGLSGGSGETRLMAVPIIMHFKSLLCVLFRL